MQRNRSTTVFEYMPTIDKWKQKVTLKQFELLLIKLGFNPLHSEAEDLFHELGPDEFGQVDLTKLQEYMD